MPEHLIGTRFSGRHFPVGSVATFLNHQPRTVFPTVTKLSRHETIVGGSETGRWRVRFTGLQLITAGPIDHTRDRRARPRTSLHVADRRAAHPVRANALQHRHTQPESVDEGVPPVPEPVVRSTPDAESAPTLDLPTAPLTRRLENQHPRLGPLTAATCEPTCQDYWYDLMIDPMANGTVNRGSEHLRRRRRREALSTHPPAPVDDATRGSLEQPAGQLRGQTIDALTFQLDHSVGGGQITTWRPSGRSPDKRSVCSTSDSRR